jgi:hypothetical protein
VSECSSACDVVVVVMAETMRKQRSVVTVTAERVLVEAVV